MRPCERCGYEFDHEQLGRYGCPNCHHEDMNMSTKLFSDAGHKWAGSDHGRWEPLPSLVQLREEAIHADAELRVEEWAGDWEIIENHVRSGDFTITKQTANLIVAARTTPRGPHRARLMETVGEHILLDLRESLLREAVEQIEREEALRG